MRVGAGARVHGAVRHAHRRRRRRPRAATREHGSWWLSPRALACSDAATGRALSARRRRGWRARHAGGGRVLARALAARQGAALAPPLPRPRRPHPPPLSPRPARLRLGKTAPPRLLLAAPSPRRTPSDRAPPVPHCACVLRSCSPACRVADAASGRHLPRVAPSRAQRPYVATVSNASPTHHACRASFAPPYASPPHHA
jgi:hypothetical protein